MNAPTASKTSWLLPAVLIILFLLSLVMFGVANYQANAGEGFTPAQQAGQILSASLMLAVPLALFYFSIYLLVIVYQRKRQTGEISGRLATWLYRTPRIAAILIIGFISLFALDVFGGPQSIWVQIGGFIIHAAPAIILAILLAVAWRYEWVGALTFGLAALYFLRLLLINTLSNLGTLLLFSGPLLLIALLFWLNWHWKKQIHLGAPG